MFLHKVTVWSSHENDVELVVEEALQLPDLRRAIPSLALETPLETVGRLLVRAVHRIAEGHTTETRARNVCRKREFMTDTPCRHTKRHSQSFQRVVWIHLYASFEPGPQSFQKKPPLCCMVMNMNHTRCRLNKKLMQCRNGDVMLPPQKTGE